MSRRAAKDRAEKRRAELAVYVASGGYTQRDLARMLHVGVGTVNRDLKILRKRWRKTYLTNTDAVMTEDLHRVSEAVAGIWSKVIRGNTPAVRALIELLKFRAEILDYKPPTRLDIKYRGKIAVREVVMIRGKVRVDVGKDDDGEDDGHGPGGDSGTGTGEGQKPTVDP